MPLIINGVEIENLIVINTATGEQVDIETLQDQMGNILFQKQTAPAWFNYTGIDINGNYEGTSAYDGTAVAYGIGKPNITVATDGTETIGWSKANGLNDDYFVGIYGSQYVKEWGKRPNNDEIPTPIQVVEDVLVIPDTYKGKPITTLFENSFYAHDYSTGAGAGQTSLYYQPSFYRSIVFGANITALQDNCFSLMENVTTINLPETIKNVDSGAFGTAGISFTGSTLDQPIIVVNSNLESTGISNYIHITKFSSNVTIVNAPMNNTSALNDTIVFVFYHSANAEVTIQYASKPKTAQAVTIYTDNTSVLNYDWSTNANITATFKSLSDYAGG